MARCWSQVSGETDCTNTNFGTDEKKDKMTEVFTEADVPKLETGSYIDLVGVLKKFMGDSHIGVAQSAVKAMGALAKGLRENFIELAKELYPLML